MEFEVSFLFSKVVLLVNYICTLCTVHETVFMKYILVIDCMGNEVLLERTSQNLYP
jgi:hypothetical protein